MTLDNLTTIDQVADFLAGTQSIAFAIAGSKDERYQLIEQLLKQFDYPSLKRVDKGIFIQFLMKLSGYSRQQLTRMIRRYRQTGRLQRHQRTTNGFKTRYTRHDIRLLAALDQRHDTPNGLRVKKLCERAYQVFGDTAYKRLATISVAHIYNLRRSTAYQQQRTHFTKTQPHKGVSIGQRRKPKSNGQPGYIRIDTVHQGDLDGCKGVYHINAVDEVTQFEVVVSVEKISEAYLLPALEYLLDAFPFLIINFHSDNGSEYINHTVARLLKKLLIEFTKSRPRHCNDNALAEGKNAAVVRKIYGYSHIPQHHAALLNDFNRTVLNPYVNYHRPCLFPRDHTNNKGKVIKRYDYSDVMTPYEKLKSLENPEQYLKPEMTLTQLDDIAKAMSDNEAADQLQKARQQLFKRIHEEDKKRA